jgi:indolepyruvate ferredoxin oxidoreductase alpha subunit
MKLILSGNEAIARGFFEAGGALAAAYPGTPSTEVLEAFRGFEGVYAEWSTNEKVALEVAFGGSLAGVRSMACMKHVGLNVASDTLMTLSYAGANAGLVVMVADDPGMFSSQNEQDSRQYARFAKMPCLEPSDSREAMELVKTALSLSEDFDTPVMLRTTTRVSHSKGGVEISDPAVREARGLVREPSKYVMLPSYARERHEFVERRLEALRDWAESSPVNPVHDGGRELGIITHGISYQYAREAFPDASILKLGMTWPLPEKLIRGFAGRVSRLAVVEELDPFIETEIRAMGIEVHYGKGMLPVCGEYTKDILIEKISGRTRPSPSPVTGLPVREPAFCPGCSHRGLFTVLSKLGAFVSGDIGCYTLGGLPPFGAMHSNICMGASIPAAHGISRALGLKGIKGKPVAVIGDSTFLHSGITGLMDMVYNRGDAVVVIMDNGTTGMTGGQEHPGTSRTAMGAEAPGIDIQALCRAIGAKRVKGIDAYDLKGLEEVLKEELADEGVSVLVSSQVCALKQDAAGRPLVVDRDRCDACGSCLKVGCIALSLKALGGRNFVEIDPLLCNGCSVCMQVCGPGAVECTDGRV